MKISEAIRAIENADVVYSYVNWHSNGQTKIQLTKDQVKDTLRHMKATRTRFGSVSVVHVVLEGNVCFIG